MQLSSVYDAEGWPGVRLPLHHVAMLTRAEALTNAINGLAATLPSRGWETPA